MAIKAYRKDEPAGFARSGNDKPPPNGHGNDPYAEVDEDAQGKLRASSINALTLISVSSIRALLDAPSAVPRPWRRIIATTRPVTKVSGQSCLNAARSVMCTSTRRQWALSHSTSMPSRRKQLIATTLS
jgi:hypothetical protein